MSDKLMKEILKLSDTLNAENLNTRKKELSYQCLFNKLPIMLFVTKSKISPENMNYLHFIKTNMIVSDILGYSEDELISKPFIELIHPDDRQNTMNLAISENLDVLDKNNNVSIVDFTNRYLHKDGEYIYLKWLGVVLTEFGYTYTAIDVTNDNKIQQKFIELDLVCKNYPSFMITTDLDGDIFNVNNNAIGIIKKTKNQLLHTNISHIFDPNIFISKYDNTALLEIDINNTELALLRSNILSSNNDVIGYIYTGHTKDLLKHLFITFKL